MEFVDRIEEQQRLIKTLNSEKAYFCRGIWQTKQNVPPNQPVGKRDRSDISGRHCPQFQWTITKSILAITYHFNRLIIHIRQKNISYFPLHWTFSYLFLIFMNSVTVSQYCFLFCGRGCQSGSGLLRTASSQFPSFTNLQSIVQEDNSFIGFKKYISIK